MKGLVSFLPRALINRQYRDDCVWGPNQNEAIDGCYVNDACNTKKVPAQGGTIMSYCHLREEGINLSLGFGNEPGNVIRYITSHFGESSTPLSNSCITIDG